MSESDAIAQRDPAWDADVARDRALSNEALAREIADLAADGRGIYGTVLGLLNRIRPADTEPVDVEALKTSIAHTIIGPRRDMPPSSRFSLEHLQRIRWDMADANERNDARGAADAIVDRHILPLLDGAGRTPGLPLPTAEPDWVSRVFALVRGQRETVNANGVALTVEHAAHLLDPALEPIQIVTWFIGEPGNTRQRLRMTLKALFAGAERHRRPVEIAIHDKAWTGSDHDREPPEGLLSYIQEMERLGFHRLSPAEGVTPVAMGYLPAGLELPFTEAHRVLARGALGLDRSACARRNAFLAHQGSQSYALWMEMRASGYARRSDEVAGRAFFWLTPKGAEAALAPGESLVWDTLPDEAVLD